MSRLHFFCGLLLLSLQAAAQPGTPVTSFGSDGFVRADFGNLSGMPQTSHLGNGIIYSPDGKLYTVSEIGSIAYLTRWNPDGTIDPTFRNGGFSEGVKMGLPTAYLQADGKIVVAGYTSGTNTSNDFALARFLPDGQLDPSFGEGGKVSTPMSAGSGIDWIVNVVIQPDGKIVAGGFANGSFVSPTHDFALARYLPNGMPDATFGSGGKVITPLHASQDRIYALALQGDGKIVAAGSAGTGAATDLAVVRYLANGTPDNSFNGTGTALFNIQAEDVATSVILQPDNRIVIGGYSHNGSLNQALVMRLLPNGSPDPSFNGTGRFLLPGMATGSSVMNLRLQPDGKLIGSMQVETGPANGDFGFFRVNGDGTPDGSFHGTGRVVIAGPNDEQINMYNNSMVLQPDGKVALVGFEYIGSPASLIRTQTVVLRYKGDGTPDNGFGANGKATGYVNQGTTRFTDGFLQADGKLVVSGSWNTSSNANLDNDFIAARYNADGTVDATFNGTGRVSAKFSPNNDFSNAMARQPDGKILIAGNATITNTPANTDFAILRLTADGFPDASFGTGGRLTFSFGSSNEVLNDILVQPDGKILATGISLNGANGNDIILIRLNANGSPDASFGNAGRVLTSLSTGNGADAGRSLALQPDGKILVAGTYTSAGTKCAVIRYNPNGTLDNTFNGTGWKALALGSQNESFGGESLVVTPDGKILATAGTIGNSALGTIAQVMAARLLPNGNFDHSFNGTGKAFIHFGGRPALAGSIQLQDDGKVLVGARSTNFFNNSDFALARLLTDGTMDLSFGGTGTSLVEATHGDETLSAMVLDKNRAYAIGQGAHPGSVGVIAAVSLGKLQTLSSLAVSPASQQYSDAVQLTARVSPGTLGGVQPATSVSFAIGNRLLGSAPLSLNPLTAQLEASLPVLLSELDGSASVVPGTTTITATFEALPAYHVPPATAALTITPEDALVSYTGNTFVTVLSPRQDLAVTATVPLRATVRDMADGQPGNISRSLVRFLLVDNSGSTPIVTSATDASGWMRIQLLQPGDSTVGTAALIWQTTLAANDLSENYTIAMEVGGPGSYHSRNHAADRTIVTVSRPDKDFITGGGTLPVSSSAGTYAASTGTEMNFGFNSKFNGNGKKAKGKASVLFRRLDGNSMQVYQIKTTKLISMGVMPGTGDAAMGSLVADAQLFDVTIPGHPVLISSNLQLAIHVTDKGEPGSHDEISIALYAANGTLVMASHWLNGSAVKQPISGGNIRVSGGHPDVMVRRADLREAPHASDEAGGLSLQGSNLSGQQFVLRITSSHAAPVSLRITDASGRAVEVFRNISPGTTLHLGGRYHPGVYFAEVVQGKDRRLLKLIKQ